MGVCDGLVVRSNWRVYLEEFGVAVRIWEEVGLSLKNVCGLVDKEDMDLERLQYMSDEVLNWKINGPMRIEKTMDGEAMTNFEAKYFACGEPVYELQVKPIGSLKE